MHVPEYASKSVVVIVPMAARATARPDNTASRRLIYILFLAAVFTTSLTALVMSTLKSMTEPLAPIKTEAMKICVRFRS